MSAKLLLVLLAACTVLGESMRCSRYIDTGLVGDECSKSEVSLSLYLARMKVESSYTA